MYGKLDDAAENDSNLDHHHPPLPPNDFQTSTTFPPDWRRPHLFTYISHALSNGVQFMWYLFYFRFRNHWGSESWRPHPIFHNNRTYIRQLINFKLHTIANGILYITKKWILYRLLGNFELGLVHQSDVLNCFQFHHSKN